MKLLSTGNPKIMKGEKMGYNSYILHLDRKSTRLNSSHVKRSRMPSSA